MVAPLLNRQLNENQMSQDSAEAGRLQELLARVGSGLAPILINADRYF
jgi:hypothetical protein